jgi:hypothetical protein
MIKINLRSYIKDAAPEDVFVALSDRDGLKELMPRLSHAEFCDHRPNSETVIMYMSIGKGFGTIRCEGTLSWSEPRTVTFSVHNPLPVEMNWTMSPAVNGTEIDIAMRLNLEPMLGPMANFVPRHLVEEMMIKEMKYAIKQVAVRVKEGVAQDRAAAA